MIARLLISNSDDLIKQEINRLLQLYIGNGMNHPDLLYFYKDTKLGIAEARQIKEHFSLKPYSAKGRAAVLENASLLTPEAQNALLKTLEELPQESLFILGAKSDTSFLPTIISRCEIVYLSGSTSISQTHKFQEDITMLIKSNTQKRFEYIEKLKEREEFLNQLVAFFHKNKTSTAFLKSLLQAEEWSKQNVNIRAILEYIMLVMPIK